MYISPTLQTLAQYMAGEFDNHDQAIAEPLWYVHLKLWQRPAPFFIEDSLTLFAEQANALHLDRPYRQRLMRLRQTSDPQRPLTVQYYAFKNPSAVSGTGVRPEMLSGVTLEELELLPGCVLNVTQPQPSTFVALSPPDSACYFSYEGEKRQVSLGFEAMANEFASYDKGIDIETGQAIWGAIMGPYRFTKRQGYSFEF